MRIIACLVLLLSIAPVCAQSNLLDVDARMADFATAWSDADAEAVRAMLAADAVLINGANGGTLAGPDAIMPWVRAEMETPRVLVVASSASLEDGDFAYQMGRWRHGTDTGVHTFVWRRGADGAWRITAFYILGDSGE